MSAPPSPSTDYLSEIVLDNNRDLPLHAQLRTALERLIHDHFEDRSRFYSESQLISNLNVSQGTVRRALADLALRGLLEKRPARSTIVRKRAAAIGFRNLAVFLPDYSSRAVATYLSLFSTECMNRGMRIQPIYTHRGERLLSAYDYLNFAPDQGGVILLENSPRATIELGSALMDKGYECVVLGTVIRNAQFKFVGGCNRSMMEIGLQHLTGLGHREIVLLVNEPEEKESVQERIAGFQAAIANSPLNLKLRIARSGMRLWDDAYEAAYNTMPKVMEVSDPPTALFAISDVGALGAMKWLQQHGYRVPEDISVMGADGVDLGAMVHPTLTSLISPMEEMAKAALQLLMDRSPEQRKLLFQSLLVDRESTGPVPASAPVKVPA